MVSTDEKEDVSVIAKAMPDKVVCPIFSISNVSGEGIPKLKEFISSPKSRVRSSG